MSDPEEAREDCPVDSNSSSSSDSSTESDAEDHGAGLEFEDCLGTPAALRRCDPRSYWLLEEKPDEAALQAWQSQVLPKLTMLFVIARLFQIFCGVFYMPRHLAICLHLCPLAIIPVACEVVMGLLTIAWPRLLCLAYHMVLYIYCGFVFVAYWFPQVFNVPLINTYEHKLDIVQHMSLLGFLMPFQFSLYMLVPLLMVLLFTALTAVLTVLLSQSGWILSDILDALVCLAFIVVMVCFSWWQRREFEKAQQQGFLLSRQDLLVGERKVKLLVIMLPQFVVRDLVKDPDRAGGQLVQRASVLFVLIKNFDRVSRRLEPKDLLAFLNEVFTKLDSLCSKHDVTKLETIGEEFVCAVGVSPSHRKQDAKEGHQHILGQLIELALDMLQLQYCMDVELQMGIHTGPLVAGVVGQKLPRFRLFGDTMNTAARIMQNGLTGEVQFGNATYKELPSWVQVRHRGTVEMKGKGPFVTYLLQRPVTEHVRNVPSSLCGSIPVDSALLRTLFQARGDGELACPIEPVPEIEPSPSPQDGHSNSRLDIRQFSRRHQVTVAKLKHGTRVGFRKGLARSRWFFCFKWACVLGEEQRPFLEWVDAHYGVSEWTSAPFMLDLHLGGLCLLTGLEIAMRPSTFHVTRFLVLRAVIFVIVMSWRITISCFGGSSVRMKAAVCLILRCLVVALMTASYWLEPTATDSSSSFPLSGLSQRMLSLSSVAALAYLMAARQYLVLYAVFSVVIPRTLISCLVLFLRSDLGDGLDVVSFYWSRAIAIFAVVRAILWEGYLRNEFEIKESVDQNTKILEGMLDNLLPPMVAMELKESQKKVLCLSHKYSHATVAQSDLCGFTKLASQLEPEEVVRMITELFGAFDSLADCFGVYKIETVGDAYIAGQAEHPLTSINSPSSVVDFALGMIVETHRWSKQRGLTVTCRVGVHTGACVGGIVGSHMQRYHLFGRMMSSLEVLEATAPEGRVQISTACRDAVRQEVGAKIKLKLRPEPVLCTSKGVVHQYSEVGGATFLVESTSDNQ